MASRHIGEPCSDVDKSYCEHESSGRKLRSRLLEQTPVDFCLTLRSLSSVNDTSLQQHFESPTIRIELPRLPICNADRSLRCWPILPFWEDSRSQTNPRLSMNVTYLECWSSQSWILKTVGPGTSSVPRIGTVIYQQISALHTRISIREWGMMV